MTRHMWTYVQTCADVLAETVRVLRYDVPRLVLQRIHDRAQAEYEDLQARIVGARVQVRIRDGKVTFDC